MVELSQSGAREPARMLTASLVVLALSIAAGPAAAEPVVGPPEAASAAPASAPPVVLIDERLAWNLEMQTWGHALLGTGAAVIITGTIMIEADGQGGVGKAGFASIGAGIGVMTVGMFLLGFSQPVHLEERAVALAPTPGGALLAYDRYF